MNSKQLDYLIIVLNIIAIFLNIHTLFVATGLGIATIAFLLLVMQVCFIISAFKRQNMI